MSPSGKGQPRSSDVLCNRAGLRGRVTYFFASWTPPETSGSGAAVMVHLRLRLEGLMAKQVGFWRLAEISAGGDPLETLNATVDFERFRPILERASGKTRNPKGERPPLDVVLKFRMLALQSLHGLSLDPTERMVRDRLSWMRSCGLRIADTGPDANTLWDVMAFSETRWSARQPMNRPPARILQPRPSLQERLLLRGWRDVLRDGPATRRAKGREG